MSFLDTLIYGYREIRNATIAVTRRNAINFTAGLTAVDNPTTKTTDVSAAAAAAPPTGTGFRHVTVNVEDATAKLVDVTNPAHVDVSKVLPVAQGGTNLAAVGAALQILRTNAGATDLEFVDLIGTLILGGAVDQVLTSDGTSVVYTKTSNRNRVEGESTVDMADGDYTASAGEANATIITNGSASPQTADRTLFLPTAADAAAYSRFVRNANGQGFNVVVQDVAAGTTVTIADGFGAWVGIHGVGAFRMGADVAN